MTETWLPCLLKFGCPTRLDVVASNLAPGSGPDTGVRIPLRPPFERVWSSKEHPDLGDHGDTAASARAQTDPSDHLGTWVYSSVVRASSMRLIPGKLGLVAKSKVLGSSPSRPICW